MTARHSSNKNDPSTCNRRFDNLYSPESQGPDKYRYYLFEYQYLAPPVRFQSVVSTWCYAVCCLYLNISSMALWKNNKTVLGVMVILWLTQCAIGIGGKVWASILQSFGNGLPKIDPALNPKFQSPWLPCTSDGIRMQHTTHHNPRQSHCYHFLRL